MKTKPTYKNPELLKKAKERCSDCHALRAGKHGKLRCDEGGCDITQVIRCLEWEDPEVGYIGEPKKEAKK